MNPEDFEDFEVENKNGNRKVRWEWIGEGWNGDFDRNDIHDVPFLRFYCDKKENGEWVEMENASYYTRMPVDSPKKYLKQAAEIILKAIEKADYKRLLQELSWFCPEDFEKKTEFLRSQISA